MPRAPPVGFYALSAVVLLIWYMVWTHRHSHAVPTGISQLDSIQVDGQTDGSGLRPVVDISVDDYSLNDKAIMGKLGNETAKAELGRAAWKLFHTMMGRFPDKPEEEERKALKDYIHLFARLYPCGECATHFQQILKKYPPQVSSRSTAAAWACFVHNEVNISKGKPVFDCANIGDWYDCGCADDEKTDIKKHGEPSESVAGGNEPVEIQRDGLMNGG